jgi:hypothetical protein
LSGHLREPVLFITNTLRALGVGSNGSFTTDYVLGDSFLPSNLKMGQDVFRSPTVFNYYPPDYQMSCPLSPNCPLAPEFAILDSSTAFARINFAYEVVYQTMPTSADRPTGTWIDTLPFEAESNPATDLVTDLNTRLMAGTMSDALKNAVLRAVTAIDEADPTSRVREAIYLIVTSPEYQVQR